MIALTVRAAVENLGDLLDVDPMTLGCEGCHAEPGQPCDHWCPGLAAHLAAVEDRIVGTVTTAGALVSTDRARTSSRQHQGKALRFYGLETGKPYDVVCRFVRAATAQERRERGPGTVTVGFFRPRYGVADLDADRRGFAMITLPAAAEVVLGDTLHRDE